eukprot:gene5008-6994_t
MSTDNNKRKLLAANIAVKGVNKLKRVSLSVFDEEESGGIIDTSRNFHNNVPNDRSNSSSLLKNTNEIDNDDVISSDVKNIVTKTAVWVLDNPSQVNALIEKSRGNPILAFLIENDSPSGKFYIKEIERIKTEREVQSICSGAALPPSIPIYAPPPPVIVRPIIQTNANITIDNSNSNNNNSANNKNNNSERKNRWGAIPIPTMENNSLVTTSISNNDLEYDLRMQKLLREQKEMQLIEQRIRESAKGNLNQIVQSGSTMDNKQNELYEERLKEYRELARLYDEKFKDTIEDAERNNGIIDGGTWEHRKRAKEMLETAEKNLLLTLSASNGGSSSRHISDYLPKDVLESFLKHADNVKKGIKSNNNDNNNDTNKITENNIGFQLLKKSGWNEGDGLGLSNNGIINPIQSSSSTSLSFTHNNNNNDNLIIQSSVDSGGIGVKPTHEVEADDDAFDSYRKRMMLAYRFRPNPLNNPRRNYY